MELTSFGFGRVHSHLFVCMNIKINMLSWAASSMEPDQTARMRLLAWLYTGDTDFIQSTSAVKGLKSIFEILVRTLGNQLYSVRMFYINTYINMSMAKGTNEPTCRIKFSWVELRINIESKDQTVIILQCYFSYNLYYHNRFISLHKLRSIAIQLVINICRNRSVFKER